MAFFCFAFIAFIGRQQVLLRTSGVRPAPTVGGGVEECLQDKKRNLAADERG
jgi:hypothetical protein